MATNPIDELLCAGANPLATEDQIALEKLSLRIAASPALRQAREQARALLLDDSSARTPDGAAGLDRALDQWLLGQVVAVTNNDPSRPQLMWAIDNTPRCWFGHTFPGAAVAIDNPDNINRTGLLDGRCSYVLEGRFGKPAAAQTSINVTGAEQGQLRWGDAIATLMGWFMLRRQNLPEAADIPGLVKSTRLVKLAELAMALPVNTPKADAALRQREILARIAQHQLRSAQN